MPEPREPEPIRLIRNIHGIANVPGLDGDELGYLLPKVADLEGPK